MLAERPVQTVEGDVNRPDRALNTAALWVGSDSSLVHAGGAAVMSNWEALRIGMTEEDVHALLGVPSRRQTMSVLSYWFYEVGTAYIRPHVTFDDHQVYGWSAP